MHPSSRPLRRLSPTKLQAYVSPLEFFFFSFFLSPALCVESPSFSAVHLGLIFFPQVALVDTTGVIVTALSSSDLRVLTTGHKFRLKGITALQLVQKSRALEANARPAIVCARLTTHLSEIASKVWLLPFGVLWEVLRLSHSPARAVGRCACSWRRRVCTASSFWTTRRTRLA
eukprot:m.237992 g.237992  ORF g.237992 m.237992 type:complete len:173 (-) comp54343_c1_seq3:235-753(-)